MKKVCITGLRYRLHQSDISMTPWIPAAVALPAAFEFRIQKAVLLAVCERGERLDQRTQWSRLIGSVPAGGKHISGTGIEQDVLDGGI